LPKLIALKYQGMGHAVAELRPVKRIREAFVGFQERLYSSLDRDVSESQG